MYYIKLQIWSMILQQFVVLPRELGGGLIGGYRLCMACRPIVNMFTQGNNSL